MRVQRQGRAWCHFSTGLSQKDEIKSCVGWAYLKWSLHQAPNLSHCVKTKWTELSLVVMDALMGACAQFRMFFFPLDYVLMDGYFKCWCCPYSSQCLNTILGSKSWRLLLVLAPGPSLEGLWCCSANMDLTHKPEFYYFWHPCISKKDQEDRQGQDLRFEKKLEVRKVFSSELFRAGTSSGGAVQQKGPSACEALHLWHLSNIWSHNFQLAV